MASFTEVFKRHVHLVRSINRKPIKYLCFRQEKSVAILYLVPCDRKYATYLEELKGKQSHIDRIWRN